MFENLRLPSRYVDARRSVSRHLMWEELTRLKAEVRPPLYPLPGPKEYTTVGDVGFDKKD